jgi:phosphopantothenoylcysteine decarboxylase / phosphopantothenate---cysteine ligase
VSVTIVLGITGSIAAYKAVEIARLFRKAGHRVIPVMTASASKFVGAVTFSGICGEAVRHDMWDSSAPGEMHVELAELADLVLVAPVTADAMARFASGRADDLLAALVLCRQSPLLLAPAMHPRMWNHPATQRNAVQLRADGVHFAGPAVGLVASGDSGVGRMEDPGTIVELALALAPARTSGGVRAADPAPVALASRDLQGKKVVITAGPTYEDIDPVRFLGNRSSGTMGFALAARAAARGALVTMIAGPVERETPTGVSRINVRSAEQMRNAVMQARRDLAPDAIIMAAAVADFRPSFFSTRKLKKTDGMPAVSLTANADILRELGATRGASACALVGFALETGTDEDVIGYAQGKLAAKHADLIVANHASEALGGDTNRVHLVARNSVRSLASAHKDVVADAILSAIVWNP